MTERDDLPQEALDIALAALENGASLESVLAADPAHAAELRPLLMTALAVGAGDALPGVPAPAQAASRAQFLAAAADRRPALVPASGGWARLRRWLFGWQLAGSSLLARGVAMALVVLAGLSLGGYGAVAASAQSLPGDALYGVKRTVENTELLLANDAQARARLQTEFDDRRVHETLAVADQGRLVPVEFTGTLISMNGPQSQQWLVSGIAVVVGPQVPVQGQPVIGGRVFIQGMIQSAGLVQAQRVAVLPDEAGTPVVTPTGTVTVSPTPPATATASEMATSTPAPASSTSVPSLEAPADTVAPGASATAASATAASAAATSAAATNPPPASATPAETATEDHGGGPGPSASNTPPAETATDGGGDNGGGGPSQTAAPTKTDDHGGQASNTPQPTSNGDHGGGSHTPEPTEGGDHSGASPSNTPKPDD